MTPCSYLFSADIKVFDSPSHLLNIYLPLCIMITDASSFQMERVLHKCVTLWWGGNIPMKSQQFIASDR